MDSFYKLTLTLMLSHPAPTEHQWRVQVSMNIMTVDVVPRRPNLISQKERLFWGDGSVEFKLQPSKDPQRIFAH